MMRQIKGVAPWKDKSKKKLLTQAPLLCLQLPHAHLTSELPPGFIHADLSLSRRIYMLCCRAKVVSHFIWVHRKRLAELFWYLCCLLNAAGSKASLGGRFGSHSKPDKGWSRCLCCKQKAFWWLYPCLCAAACKLLHVCRWACECQVNLNCLSQSEPASPSVQVAITALEL